MGAIFILERITQKINFSDFTAKICHGVNIFLLYCTFQHNIIKAKEPTLYCTVHGRLGYRFNKLRSHHPIRITIHNILDIVTK